MSCSHVPSFYFLNKLKLFHSSCSIPQQGYCFSLTNVPKRVKFDPNIKILHHNLFVVYNCFRRDENDTVLKWVERLRRLIFWWLEIWAIARSLLYRDQVHTLLFPTSKPNWFEYATNLDPSTEWLVLIGLNNFVASNIDELDSWYECVGKYDWFSCHISLNNLGQNLLYKCSKQPSWLFWVRHYWSEWRGLLSPAGIECSTSSRICKALCRWTSIQQGVSLIDFLL